LTLECIQCLTYTFNQQGLSGVPLSVHYLCEEVGLAGLAWETMGAKWRALGSLWLHAEQALSKSGRTDLSFNEVQSPIFLKSGRSG